MGACRPRIPEAQHRLAAQRAGLAELWLGVVGAASSSAGAINACMAHKAQSGAACKRVPWHCKLLELAKIKYKLHTTK